MARMDQLAGGSGALHAAKEKTAKVKDQLEVAGAELHLVHTALERNLPASGKQRDVQKALNQGAAVEKKIVGAAEELQEVKDLLEEEVAEKERLERELRKARKGEAGQ